MDPREANQILLEHVRPDTYPVAIKLCQHESEIPERARRPLKNLNHRVTVCQAVGMARRYGWVLAVGKEDQVCPYGMLMLGHLPRKQDFMDGTFYEKAEPGREKAGARTAQVMPYLEHGKYSHLVAAPLHRTEFEPDLLCVYGNSAVAMRLVQGATWFDGGMVQSASAGTRDCADIVADAFLHQQPRYVLPCNGDRVFGMAQDYEMAFTMPWSDVDRVLQGVVESHKGGLQRYPVTTFMRFEPQMPTSYNQLREFLQEGEEG